MCRAVPRIRPGWHVAVLAALLLYFLWNCLYYTPYVVDDAFISFRYARNLVEGHGLVYNPGEYVEGYSNFLWVLLEAGLLAADLPILAGVKVLGVASGLAAVVMTFFLGRILFEHRPAVGLLAAGMLCFNTSLAVWTQAGLETAFFTALIVGMCLRHETERRRGAAFPLSAILFGLVWLTRPEAPVYGLYFLARRLSKSDRKPLDRRDAVWLAVLLSIVVSYEVWGLSYYGALFPNTHAAKIGDGGPVFERAATASLSRSQLFQFVISQGWGFAGVFLVGVLGSLRRARLVPAAVWAPVASAVIFLLYAWSDWMPRFRFVVPAMPSLFLMVAFGVVEFGVALSRRRIAKPLWVLGIAVALVGYAQHQMFAGYYRDRTRRNFDFAAGARGMWPRKVPANLGRTLYPIQNTAWAILELAPRREWVAIADIGFPGYLTMNPVWDLRGLVTPAAARAKHGDAAAVRAAVDDLLGRDPALIVFPPSFPSLDRFHEELLNDPRTRRRYDRVESEDGERVRYQRKDLPGRIPRARILRALEGFPEYDSKRAREYR